MARVIGNADDFYRIRMMRVDESDELDLEWREDILYRRPATDDPDEYELYRVEAVRNDDDEVTVSLATFETKEEAYTFSRVVSEDLAEMTKSEFEDTYFPEG